MKCDLCEGHYRDKNIVLAFRREGRSVVVEDVPARVCDVCGDTLLTEGTIHEVDELLEQQAHGAAPLYRLREKVPATR